MYKGGRGETSPCNSHVFVFLPLWCRSLEPLSSDYLGYYSRRLTESDRGAPDSIRFIPSGSLPFDSPLSEFDGPVFSLLGRRKKGKMLLVAHVTAGQND